RRQNRQWRFSPSRSTIGWLVCGADFRPTWESAIYSRYVCQACRSRRRECREDFSRPRSLHHREERFAKELKKSRLLSCDFEALVVSDENDLMINVEVHISIASRTAAKRVFLGCHVSAVS